MKISIKIIFSFDSLENEVKKDRLFYVTILCLVQEPDCDTKPHQRKTFEHEGRHDVPYVRVLSPKPEFDSDSKEVYCKLLVNTHVTIVTCS